MVRYIVIVGGVMSGVGKGVTTASIGKILQEYGYRVTAIKIDPYINYDAGTLRPTEHGEVWVTDDGGEIDQDLGNYERFFGTDIPKRNNITTGQIYKTLIDKERNGEFLGETVQFIPHVPEEIKNRIKTSANDYDFALVEIGGTIGDYENVPFLFAMKSLERESGMDSVAYVLITYLPTPSHNEEMKTKPTQQAIRMLSEHGIFPDFIVCRAKTSLDEIRKKKIETYVNIQIEHIISEPDIETIYQIPIDLEKERLGHKLLAHFGMQSQKKPDWGFWHKALHIIKSAEKKLNVAIVGKYVKTGDYQLADSYISINHALIHAGIDNNVRVRIEWIDSNLLEKSSETASILKAYDGILIPGGFGAGGVEGKISAINYARLNNIPYLGLCYGLQLAVIEYARNVCGMLNANTTEIDTETPYPVVDILPSQKEVIKTHGYGATMRLGAYAAVLRKNSLVFQLYERTNRLKEDTKRIADLKRDKSQRFRLGISPQRNMILERHRHRYEVNPNYVATLEKKGLIFSGHHTRKDNTVLREFIELTNHRFFVATQSHPEFKSKPDNPAPLFFGFVEAMCNKL